jgi:type IV pilus assembly protein PilA
MEKKMNNKGFSLVELIIVIAIMAVLVGVLAPQFIKYVESSRRSTDIQNAENIKTAILTDIADGTITASITTATDFDGTTIKASTIAASETPKVQGSVGSNKGANFKVTYSVTDGTCQVYAGADTNDLTTTTGAAAYKAE